MAERQFGPYKLIRQIAVGGMAEIHLAKTAGIAGFEKYVALKMIHPNFAADDQFIQMLVDEAKIAVQLTHGNIAQTFDLGRVGDTYYITMEYVDGADLYKILRRASEQDIEMPLDVCAFLGKEVSSALDHAHRKRDHTGKSLGIVHRDVSPQNVLVSYSGEVKLVDFGIAKATMKVRQTAVGVIKGKYYYMSPEQAWGDPIDHRSDIFSAGIVLYEMITGQMLYLEEDLHKLLEMARRAEIRPPSVLRKGVPPQLERIVMHALAKVPGERYQTAGDLATDLERFLHAYSPVFTASKLATLVRQVIGEPIHVPNEPAFDHIEFRDGVMSTHPLDDSEVAHAIDRAELRDENSVIFRVSELQNSEPKASAPAPAAAAHQRPAGNGVPGRSATPPPRPSALPPRSPTPPPSRPVPRETRATDSMPPVPRTSEPFKLPSIVAKHPTKPPVAKPPIAKPRKAHEETRQLDEPAPPNPLHDDSSGLITPDGKKLGWAEVDRADTSDVEPESDDPGADLDPESEFDNFAERTLITPAPTMPAPAAPSGLPSLHAAPKGSSGFVVDFAGDDGPVEATLITTAPPGFGGDAAPQPITGDDEEDDGGPTMSRDFAVEQHATRPSRPRAKTPLPALAANIHAPAVSELRKPRASRRTPTGGSPAVTPNVLQAIVSAKQSEPMPVPRAATQLPVPAVSPAASHATVSMTPAPLPPPPHATPPPHAMSGLPVSGDYGPFPVGTPGGGQPSYNHDASGLPLGIPTPPGTLAPIYPSMQPSYTGPAPSQGYPMSPAAMYPFQSQLPPVSLTGQLRAFEVDEIPSQYKLGAARQRWFTYIVSGVLAVSVAGGVTFLIIRSTRESAPTTGSIHLESVPTGAEVTFDGTRLTDRTPLTLEGAQVGTRHTIRIALPHHVPFTSTIDIPKDGHELSISAQLPAQVGKILVNTTPDKAEIWINGQVRGVSPTTLSGIDIESTSVVELRHKDYPPHQVTLKWDPDGLSYVEFRFAR